MISSTRIQELSQLFTNVSPGEWILFAWGIAAGILVWVLVYQKVLIRLIHLFSGVLGKDIWMILAQSALGVAIVLSNALLFNLGEVTRDFLLAAFGLSGILFGLWVFIPADS